MKNLPASWKAFRIVCFVQMILVILEWGFSARWLFRARNPVMPLLEILAYSLVFIFLYKGLSLLNENYPATPLTTKQKRHFNWLFIINVLLIAFLFAEVVAEWRWSFPLMTVLRVSFYTGLLIMHSLISGILIFLFHIVFLWGMIRLRRVIHTNTLNNWYNQFEEGTALNQ